MIDFTCSQKALKEAVGKVIKAVPAKAQMQILENIKIDVQWGGAVFLTGYDLTTGITASLEATVNNGDVLLVNAKLFNSVVKKLPKGEIHIYSDEHYKLTIEKDTVCFTLLALNADEYPEVEKVHSAVQKFSLPQQTFQTMLAQTLYARSTNDAKPILKGAHFDIESNVLDLVAIDGFRCAIRNENVSSECDFNFTVNGEALEKIQGMLSSDSGATATIVFYKNHISFKLEKGADCIIITRLLQGKFYKYKKIISGKHSTSASIEIEKLIGTLERAAVLSAGATQCVELDFTDRELKITLSSSKGLFTDKIDINSNGEAVRIGFNINFLLDALRAIPDYSAEFLLNGAISPMAIKPLVGNSYTHVLLPIRLRN